MTRSSFRARIAAIALLGAATFTWIVVGDAATVRPQLESLGLPVEVRAAQ